MKLGLNALLSVLTVRHISNCWMPDPSEYQPLAAHRPLVQPIEIENNFEKPLLDRSDCLFEAISRLVLPKNVV